MTFKISKTRLGLGLLLIIANMYIWQHRAANARQLCGLKIRMDIVRVLTSLKGVEDAQGNRSEALAIARSDLDKVDQAVIQCFDLKAN